MALPVPAPLCCSLSSTLLHSVSRCSPRRVVAAFCCSGDLTPAQALDKVTTQGYVLIDVRTDRDKAKAGVPELPSNAKNKLISVPYASISFLGLSAMSSLSSQNAECSLHRNANSNN